MNGNTNVNSLCRFWGNFARPEHIELCLDKILEGMGLEYIDLLLAHWPVSLKPTVNLKDARAGFGLSLAENGIADDGNGNEIADLENCTADLAAQKGARGSFVNNWLAMQELVKKGKCRAIGVSNFSIRELEELLPWVQHPLV